LSDEGERLARLEVMVDQLAADMREHVADHRTAAQEAKEAKETAKQAALLASIGHRSNQTAKVVAYLGGGFLVVGKIFDLVLMFTGHK